MKQFSTMLLLSGLLLLVAAYKREGTWASFCFFLLLVLVLMLF